MEMGVTRPEWLMMKIGVPACSQKHKLLSPAAIRIIMSLISRTIAAESFSVSSSSLVNVCGSRSNQQNTFLLLLSVILSQL